MNADTLERLFALNYESIKKNCSGLTQADSILQPPSGGNCLNWVVGHIVSTRGMVLGLVKQTRVMNESESKRYTRGSLPVTSSAGASEIDTLIEYLDRSQAALSAGLKGLDVSALEAPAPIEKTVGGMLALFQFHEAYHAGQTGLLRRMAGKPNAIG